ncbi:helix-turn-helix domain-containing protein [Pseudonocardia bannensis]|uniref:AraC family transcriptional regulator n=1 Tax=Pseudonocardia bannensis TaxID=630973 RepID=A0A848DII4_9PSEU|nr:helix-turn-helix transcriptional regulator [Pseudonocardia bannensis]NMH92508.1 AraC family transcriptional regulator [Pseudonocardia bannensis]
MVAPAGPDARETGHEMIRARPAAALQPFVTAYSGYRTGAAEPGTHQGVPSAHLTFLLCLDGTVEVLRMPDPARAPGSFVAMVGGLHDAPAVIAQGAPQTGLQLRLTWRGARVLLGVPAGELAGDVVDLAALLGRRTAPLLDRLATTPGWAERFALLDAALAGLVPPGQRGADPAGTAPEVGYAWDRLTATGGTLRIGALAREVGWSRRHLADRFRREVGLSPKAAARVIRFERACDLLRGPRRPALAEVAARCGYVDQAHLARDFRDLAGLTATAWLAERPETTAPTAPRPGA